MSLKSRVAARLDASYAKRQEYEELQRTVEALRQESAGIAGELATALSDLDAAVQKVRERAGVTEETLARTRSYVVFLRHQMTEIALLVYGRD